MRSGSRRRGRTTPDGCCALPSLCSGLHLTFSLCCYRSPRLCRLRRRLFSRPGAKRDIPGSTDDQGRVRERTADIAVPCQRLITGLRLEKTREADRAVVSAIRTGTGTLCLLVTRELARKAQHLRATRTTLTAGLSLCGQHDTLQRCRHLALSTVSSWFVREDRQTEQSMTHTRPPRSSYGGDPPEKVDTGPAGVVRPAVGEDPTAQ